MLLKLNRLLRKVVLVLGALYVIFGVLNKKAEQSETGHKVKHEGFQTEEFDDIW